MTPARLIAATSAVAKVFLAEMDEIAIQLQREAPEVVDDQLRAGLPAQVARLGDLGAQIVAFRVLHPQLDQFHAAGQQAAQPIDVIDDQIERVETS